MLLLSVIVDWNIVTLVIEVEGNGSSSYCHLRFPTIFKVKKFNLNYPNIISGFKEKVFVIIVLA